MARTIFGDHRRFVETYFKPFPGLFFYLLFSSMVSSRTFQLNSFRDIGSYFTGDGVRRDGDGDYWITGRVDDVINVSGHRLGT